jgi:hypothetical protein
MSISVVIDMKGLWLAQKTREASLLRFGKDNKAGRHAHYLGRFGQENVEQLFHQIGNCYDRNTYLC